MVSRETKTLKISGSRPEVWARRTNAGSNGAREAEMGGARYEWEFLCSRRSRGRESRKSCQGPRPLESRHMSRCGTVRLG